MLDVITPHGTQQLLTIGYIYINMANVQGGKIDEFTRAVLNKLASKIMFSLCIYKLMYIYFLVKILRLHFINYFDYIKVKVHFEFSQIIFIWLTKML